MASRKQFDITKHTGFYTNKQTGEEKKTWGNLGRVTLRSENGVIPDDIRVFVELTDQMIPGFENPVSAFEKKN